LDYKPLDDIFLILLAPDVLTRLQASIDRPAMIAAAEQKISLLFFRRFQ